MILRRLAVLAAAVVVVLTTGCTTPPPTPARPPATSAAKPPATAASTRPVSSAPSKGCVYTPTSSPAKPVDLPPSDPPRTGTVTLTLNMNQGDVAITMDRAKTPCTVNSFESLAKQGYYNNTSCHRLADSGTLLMLQCGDPTGTGRGGPGYSFADETYPTDKFPAGTVAMANAGKNTNGSQFFLVFGNSNLPPNYTVFGKMDAASLAVVARIAAEGQDGSNPDRTGRPNNPAKINSVTAG